MARGLRNASLKRTKRERVKRRLEKLEAVEKAKKEGSYVAKPWENRPLIQELYSFAIKSHTTKKQADERRQSTSSDAASMDLDLRSPGTPKSLDDDGTASVHSKDDVSSLTSHSSKYSLRNIETQLITKMQKSKDVPDWLSRKDRRRVFQNMKKIRKIKKTSRFKRIKRQLQKKQNSKMDAEPVDVEALSTEKVVEIEAKS